MVKSGTIYSPQNYLELVTGKCFMIDSENDVKFIEKILKKECGSVRSYPLSEIQHIVEEGLDVVLVDCMIVNQKTDDFEHVYRWFEVPCDFEDKEEVNAYDKRRNESIGN